MNEQTCRAIVYQRSGRRCEVCGRAGESVHHRNKQGRVWTPSNTLMLCGDGVLRCHGWTEAHPDHARLLGLWVPRTHAPAPVPAYVKPEQFPRSWWLLDDEGCLTWLGDPPPDHPLATARAAAVAALTTARL